MEEKLFIITGASSGIGLALTKLALSNSHRVIGVSNDQAAVSDPRYRHEVVDQAYPEQVRAFCDKLRSEGVVIDSLVLNAGCVPRPCGIDDITDEALNKVIDVNLKGTFYHLKHTGQLVRENTGTICLTASVDGVIGEPYGVMYSATKAGIISLMKSFARHYGKKGLRVNSVSPGLIDTPMTAGSGELASATTDFSIIQRMGTSEEIANGMYYLLSPESSFITGQNLIIDGGFVLK